MQRWKTLAGCVAALAVGGLLARYLFAEEKPSAKPDAEAAIRAAAEAFVKAFNAGDARAVSELWTAEGEFTDAEGQVLRGRKAIADSYTKFFKEHAKAKAEVTVVAVRMLGQQTALEEGTMKVTLPGETEPSISRYSALHVKEADVWRMAAVHESDPAPDEQVSLTDIEWLVGRWTAKSGEMELNLTYAWDEDKAFLNGRYQVTQGSKLVAGGTQKIGKGHTGQLRSWQFEKTGQISEWGWWADGGKWVVESAEVLPGGGELQAVHLLTPVNKDTFLWQTTERQLDDVMLSATKPLKVKRIKASK